MPLELRILQNNLRSVKEPLLLIGNNNIYYKLLKINCGAKCMVPQRMKWAFQVDGLGVCLGWEKRAMVATLLKKEPLGNHPFERPRRRWKRYVKLDIGKTGFAEWRWMVVAGNRIQCRAVVMPLNRLVLPPWCRLEGLW